VRGTAIEHGEAMSSATSGARGAIAPADLAELLGAFNDVTARLERTHEQLRAEVARLNGELVRANEQLERSRRLAAIGEMAAGIAHEVRNPVGSIQLYARMLEEDLASMPAQRGVAQRIGRAARGLNAIVGDVLAFAKELRPRLGEASAREIFERAHSACADVAEHVAGGHRVEWRVDAGFELWCDGSLVERAVMNIVRNALEAMAECAAPETRGHVLTLGARHEPGEGGREVGREAGWTVMFVRDTGPGLSDDVIGRMFNPFFTTRAAGTGLGLSIVHRIVEAHGGRVVVRRERPSGACVELWLPLPTADRGVGSLCRERAG
jgi:signal transduction histidine kinase